MIQLTRLNNQPLMVNCDLIKFVERSPDTVLTLVTGEKIVVRESTDEVLHRVVQFRRSLLSGLTLQSLESSSAGSLLALLPTGTETRRGKHLGVCFHGQEHHHRHPSCGLRYSARTLSRGRQDGADSPAHRRHDCVWRNLRRGDDSVPAPSRGRRASKDAKRLLRSEQKSPGAHRRDRRLREQGTEGRHRFPG